MIYPEMKEILLSFFLSLLYGAAVGLIHPTLYALIEFVSRLCALPRDISVAVKERRGIKSLFFRVCSSPRPLRPFALGIFDFLSVVIFGIGFILLTYVAADGAFRLYILATAAAAAIFTGRLFKRLFGKAISRGMGFFAAVPAFLLYIPTKLINVVICHYINRGNPLDNAEKSC